jgi:hypothetical protein
VRLLSTVRKAASLTSMLPSTPPAFCFPYFASNLASGLPLPFLPPASLSIAFLYASFSYSF